MKKLLKRAGWWRTDDGRWFRHDENGKTKGIPFSGKGENSYDMGEDGLYGCGISGKTKAEGHDVRKAALHVADSVLKTRAERGDPACWPMSPALRQLEVNQRRAEQNQKGTEWA